MKRILVVLAVVAGLAALAGCAGEQATPPAPSCDAKVTTGALPAWARSGFTPPDQPMPYVLGAGGDIVGVLFGQPLTAPPRPDRDNKILWVSRPDSRGGSLRIEARLGGS